MRELVQKRNNYPKKSYNNELYKLIANSGIGQMGRGLNEKHALDSSLNSILIPGGKLTSPLFAGWVTAYIRTAVSELLNWLATKGNNIISATTDGFITDFKDLNLLTINELKEAGLTFTHQIASYRQELGFDPVAIELKYSDPKGMIAIKTRGQLGLESKISALTGFNKHSYMNLDDLRKILIDKLKGDKTLRFSQSRLMSSLDIVKEGGHVTMIPSEKNYMLRFDNKRVVIPTPIKGAHGVYFDTIPFEKMEYCVLNRGLASLDTPKYSQKHP